MDGVRVDKGFELISFNGNEVKLESKHQRIIINIYISSTHIIIINKVVKSCAKHYLWTYDEQNLIPRKYQDIVNKYVIAYKLL